MQDLYVWLVEYMQEKNLPVDLLPDLLNDYNPSHTFIRDPGSRLRGERAIFHAEGGGGTRVVPEDLDKCPPTQ